MKINGPLNGVYMGRRKSVYGSDITKIKLNSNQETVGTYSFPRHLWNTKFNNSSYTIMLDIYGSVIYFIYHDK